MAKLEILPISSRMYVARGKKTIQNPQIPETSGVYLFWSSYELLYIGKAKNLRMRIAQHLGNSPFKLDMINPDEIRKVSVIFTKDIYDAEILETQLIQLIPTKWNKKPFYKSDWYNDWKYGEGMFAYKKDGESLT